MSGKSLKAYVAKRWKLAAAAVALALAGSAAGMTTPYLAGNAINALVSGQSGLVLAYALPIIALILVQGVLGYFTNVLAQYMAQSVAFDLRNDVYAHLQELSLGFYRRVDTGQLVARATSDIDVISRFLRNAFTGLTSAVFTLAVALYFMLSKSPLLTAYAVAPLPLVFLLVRRFARRARPLFEQSREVYGRMTSHVTEVASGLKVVRALNAFQPLWERFKAINDELLNLNLRLAWLRASTWPLVGFLSSLSALVVFWAGGGLVARGLLDVGGLVSMSMYAGMIIWPFIMLGFFTVDYMYATTATRRVFEVLSIEPEVKEAPDAVPLVVERGEVELRDVWFSYDGKRWVLKGVSFKVKPGEVVAIVGPAGSGKSTLVQLIPRFYDPQRGRILIDGVDIRKVKLDSLRRQVGIVHQDIYIFPDTIRNNIAYGKPDATQEEVERAAKLAMLHDFIASLPQGYDTVVGERGVTLSGGQRQRLAIARTLLIDPKIVILDDSMSNVDAETERAIYEAITKHFKGKTLIIITQRPSTMRLADRIVVIEDGRVVEEGRHEELLAKGGAYARLLGVLAAEAAAEVR
ncbi:MAG: ABC transporter ATP-binding protein/permease [Thermofilum sp.]|nr:ABC transporter ATP-binding protein/permease [Thermofilum sp.]MCC6065016.1 ABC transporter ATP-binding protein/permease [Thermofilum sp.]